MEPIYITEEGLQKLREELAELNKQKIKLSEVIAYARSLGDLSENAEYHAAKHEQGLLMAKINDIEDKIARAVIIDTTQMDTSEVRLGVSVRVLNEKLRKEITYTIVSPVEADLSSGKLSTQSPVGQALLGKKVGDVVEVNVPAGTLRLKVLEILPSQ
ncbi:MAG TPA: transcription elongation factor GreA [Candidatus Hydrogenedens sp.]|nr:transcription elongation factor GreA [Candidatus Hydrogenedens sp.]